MDRKALGSVVFGDPEALADLNAITHRFIMEEIDRQAAQAEAEGRPAVAIDAIALIESGVGESCDAVVGILAPKEVRIRRIMAREGISEDYARKRVEAQQGDGFFRAHCGHILENRGTRPGGIPAPRALALFRADGSPYLNIIYRRNHTWKKTKDPGELRREALLYQPKNGYDRLSRSGRGGYERLLRGLQEVPGRGQDRAGVRGRDGPPGREHGFKPFTRGMALNPGDKVYRVNRGKAVMLAVIGTSPSARASTSARPTSTPPGWT